MKKFYITIIITVIKNYFNNILSYNLYNFNYVLNIINTN